MKILNAKQMKLADQATIKNEPITSIDLMERAAFRCVQWIEEQDIEDKEIHVFCGMGNNGGDGLVIARYLYEDDYMTGTFVVHFSDTMSNDFVTNYQRAEDAGIYAASVHSLDDMPVINKDDIVIDAIFGLGLNKPPKGIAKEVISFINKSGATVYSVDVPSGLYIDKPIEANQVVVKAAFTLTFQSPKLAFLLPDNEEYVKEFLTIDIGLDEKFLDEISVNYHFTTSKTIESFFKYRTRFSHKGSFGHALIIGGSFGKIGATVLATKAALKIGSGLVTAYIPKCGYTILQTAIPEVMVEVDSADQLEFFNFKVKPTAIGVGVGMGTSDKTAKAFGKFLKENTTPLVIDADALNILSKNKEFLNYLPKDTILTPHPKELERLIGNWKNDYDKLEKIALFSKKYNCIVVLKGANTVVVKKDQFYFNASGNPALATAGTGDVLTGLITGLLAQSYTPLQASLFGVFIHGRTADFSASLGYMETFTASDIINLLPEAINSLFEYEDKLKPSLEDFEDFMDDNFDDDDFLDDFLFDDDLY
ncbi:MAG TPA: NAD(P)H-hydrate dehydratase [Lutibacter sp.]|nr:NAD(P)H-hydrate dehydratase [Lutibacter sp.]